MVAGVLLLASCNVGLTAQPLPPSLSPEAAINLDSGADVSTVTISPGAGAVPAIAAPTSPYSPLCTLTELEACNPDKPACFYDVTGAAPDSGVCTSGAICTPQGAGPPIAAAACRVVVGSDAGPAPSCSTAFMQGRDTSCTTSADCDVGDECVGGASSAKLGTCKPYCCDGPSSCTSSNSFCDIEPVFHGINLVPVCAAGEPCTPFGSGCATGEFCTLVNEATGQTACVTPGSALTGKACTTEKCAANLACISDICRELCKLSLPGQCPANQTCIASSLLGAYSDVGLCSHGT